MNTRPKAGRQAAVWMPPPADAHAFYGRLGVVLPRSRNEWVSIRCFLPGHQDRHASATVNTRNGAWKCFTCDVAGTAYDAAIAVGYTREDAAQLAQEHGLWFGRYPQEKPTRATTQPVEARIDWRQLDAAVKTPNPKVVAHTEYPYVDEHGEPLFRVCRDDLDNGRKKVWQERWDAGSGTWKPGLGETRRVLYRLPELLERARTGRAVFMVEGEKVVDALQRLDVFATTSPAGAGKWRPDYAASLAGALVFLSPDCDLPGRRHMIAIAESLLAQHTRVMGPLELDITRQDGFDLADHLAAVADTVRAVEPTIPTGELRSRLSEHVWRMARACLPLDADRLRDYRERADHFANPTGTLAYCERCQRERPHRVKAGVSYCPCGSVTVA